MTILRFRCPHPIECGQDKHWSIPSWRACEDLDDAATIRKFEEEERRREEADWEQVFTDVAEQHHVEEPSSPLDRALRDNGERHLRVLGSSHLLTLGHLTSSAIGRVNRALRSTGTVTLSEPCAADLDWAGYESNAAVLMAAARLFAALGEQAQLTAPMTAYRGLMASPNSPLSKLLGRPAPGQVFVDPGFVFAATRWEDATYFQSPGAWWGESAGDPDAQPLMLLLEIRRAICIPHPSHRSRELVTYLARTRRTNPDLFTSPVRQSPTAIERAMGQLVLAPGSRWEILGPGQPPGTLALRQLNP